MRSSSAAGVRPGRRIRFETPTCGLPPIAARRRSGRPAPQLARRVHVAQERAQHPLRHQHVGAAGQPLTVERPRARAAPQQRIVDDLDQRRRDRRPLAAARGRSLAARPRRPTSRPRAGRAARAPRRARRSPAPRRSGSCARPAWPPCAAPPRAPTASASASAAGEPRRGPVRSVALLAVGVVAQRLDRERHVRAAHRSRKPGRRRERRRARPSARRPRRRSW